MTGDGLGEYIAPEVRARVRIDEMLTRAGWVVQDYKSVNLYAGEGIAVRELVTAAGPADYVLFVNRQAVGVIEAKKQGTTLAAGQSAVREEVVGEHRDRRGQGRPAEPDGGARRLLGIDVGRYARNQPDRSPREASGDDTHPAPFAMTGHAPSTQTIWLASICHAPTPMAWTADTLCTRRHLKRCRRCR